MAGIVHGLTPNANGQPVLPPAAKSDLSTDLASSTSTVGKAVADKFALKSEAGAKDADIAVLLQNSATATGAALGSALAPIRSDVARAAASPTMLPLTRALNAGESVGAWFVGDSTGDSAGLVPANDRTAARFARRVAQAYPSHHVLFKLWDPAVDDYKAWTPVQAHPDGRRFVAFNGVRSLRWVPPVHSAAQFASGNIDVRALVHPDNLNPATPSTIVARMRKGGALGPWTNDLQFDFRWFTGGKLSIRHSQDGAAFLSDRVSTVTVPFEGAPLWVRATVEITPGTGFTAKFYTSPATDGVTWTQLGTAVSGGGATTTALYQSAEGSFFEVGANGWQPAAGGFAGKVYEVDIRDGVGGHSIAPCAVERWERYADTNTTYGGAPTLYFLNASRSGSAMSYHTDPARLRKETPDYGQTVLVFNNGHNEVGAVGSAWIPPYEAWVAAVQARTPDTAVNVIGQNPHTSAWANEAGYGAEHRKRIMELSAISARKGWGFVNVYQAFLDDPRGLGVLVSSDGLHPTQAGYEVAGDTVAKAAGVA